MSSVVVQQQQNSSWRSSFEQLLNMRPGSVFAVYEGSKKYTIYKAIQVEPFQIIGAANIPANTLNFTITSQPNQNYIPNTNPPALNPLALLYNTPQIYSLMGIIGVGWNSPYVSLTASDPGGTNFWNISSNTLAIHSGERIYTPSVFFAVFSNVAPSFTFQRRANMIFPYPINLPLVFKIYLFGNVVKFETVRPTTNINEIANLPIVYLYSPYTELFGPGR
ncbi:MAG: hypothetical protein QXV58_14395 [Saccharolobus sp.]|uniref:hypothetical protein n=1 Tax=Saccharolobus sp. TaxID=2100761 RepID=UPI003163DCFE